MNQNGEKMEEGLGGPLEKRLELVHFQLTKNCNLRCWFCGQWGKKGFFADSAGKPMDLEDWLKVTESLMAYRERTAYNPTVLFWGGEPLLCPFFDELARYVSEAGFPLELVTNGTLLHRHGQVCRECFRKIYLSVDGSEQVHDAIRGEGVFRRILENRKLLQGGKAEFILMSVLTSKTEKKLQELVQALAVFEPESLLLQERIGLTEEEILSYRDWMRETFGKEAADIYGWEMGQKEKQEESVCVAELLPGLQKQVTFPVRYLPHGAATGRKHCLSPWRHVHVAWNGEVLYCTDFYDFSAGNVCQMDLQEIFLNGKSERFRRAIQEGKCVTCEHCSWRNSVSFG